MTPRLLTHDWSCTTDDPRLIVGIFILSSCCRVPIARWIAFCRRSISIDLRTSNFSINVGYAFNHLFHNVVGHVSSAVEVPELTIIGITVNVDSMSSSQARDIRSVKEKQERSQDGTLRNSRLNFCYQWRRAIHQHLLCSIIEKWSEPWKHLSFQSTRHFKTLEQNIVVNRVKRSRHVEQPKKRNVSHVSRCHDVRHNFQEYSFCWMACTKARLVFGKKSMLLEDLCQLLVDQTLRQL